MTATRAIVLFGASGFIGRNIVEALAGKFERLIGVTGRGANVPGCDVTVAMDRLDTIPALPSETVVINTAAYRYDARTFATEQSAILTHNVAIANTVYGFCTARKISEVRLASSVAVYPSTAAILDDEVPVDLNAWPHAGEAAYAWSKRWAEICAEVHRRAFGIQTIVFRLSNPYGPFDSTNVAGAHVAPAFAIKALMPGESFEILGNPDAERDFVFAGDVARIFAASLERRGVSETYNLGYGRTATIRQLAEASLRAAGSSKRIVVASTVASGVNIRRVTAARLHRDFALGPFSDLDQGMATTVAWYAKALKDRT